MSPVYIPEPDPEKPRYRYLTLTLRVSDEGDRGSSRADEIREAAAHGCNPLPVVLGEFLSPPRVDPWPRESWADYRSRESS